eukprot:Cvel_16336.t1-p1 / transcript=Cvel_16336.t1 / gene=Cvel_16336 / organism=Chromera_velia_CCMP2878 / gene_product=hypothetical protein / transcript_product=hypothetical protein / location=Cvel_scaffold1254:436-1534(-) / protein_length=202 / sequence_SO=supercontig / SO=protein_coding / is_pseudo=false
MGKLPPPTETSLGTALSVSDEQEVAASAPPLPSFPASHSVSGDVNWRDLEAGDAETMVIPPLVSLERGRERRPPRSSMRSERVYQYASASDGSDGTQGGVVFEGKSPLSLALLYPPEASRFPTRSGGEKRETASYRSSSSSFGLKKSRRGQGEQVFFVDPSGQAAEGGRGKDVVRRMWRCNGCSGLFVSERALHAHYSLAHI